MSNRRILLTGFLSGFAKRVASALGVAGEELETEVHESYGFSAHPNDLGESLLVEVNGDPDNYVALPPAGDREAEQGETLIYHGETAIRLSGNSITIEVGGNSLTIENGTLTTDLNISTTGTIVAGGVNLAQHIHTGVSTGTGLSGVPQ